MTNALTLAGAAGIWARFLPFRVDGEVRTLINRTRDGWAVMLVNNDGITKPDPLAGGCQAAMVDASKVRHVMIGVDGPKPRVGELPAGGWPVKCVGSGRGWRVSMDVPDMRLIRIETG
jgi:hypothetical protein